MRVKCEVIQDILPLYVDELCSGETKALVEEHILECSHCKKALGTMNAELTSQVVVDEKELKKTRAPFTRVRRKFVLVSVFLVFITASVVLLTSLHSSITGERYSLEIGANYYEIDFQQLVTEIADLVGADDSTFYNVMHSGIDIDREGNIERFNLAFIAFRNGKSIQFQTRFQDGRLLIERAWDIEVSKEDVTSSFRQLFLELHSQIPWEHVYDNLSIANYDRLHITDRVTGGSGYIDKIGSSNIWVGSGGTKAFLVTDTGETLPLESNSVLPANEYGAIIFVPMVDGANGNNSRGMVAIEYYFKLK